MSSRTEVLILRFSQGYAGESKAKRDLAEQVDKGFEINSFAIDPQTRHLVYTLVKRSSPEAD
jgi:hypothetical protein